MSDKDLFSTKDATASVSESENRLCGYSGVRFSKKILLRAISGASKLTASTLISAK